MIRGRIRILLGIFLFITFLFLLTEKFPGRQRGEKARLLIPDDFLEAVETLEFGDTLTSLRLERRDKAWYIQEDSVAYRADQERVERILGELKGLQGERISKNPEKQDLYEVTEKKGLRLRLHGSKGESNFLLGKAGPDFVSTYLRPKESSEVFLIRGALRYAFPMNVTSWRNRLILALDTNAVRRVEIQDSLTQWAIEQKENVWRLENGEEVDSGSVSEMLRIASRFAAVGFEDTLGPEATGVTAPRFLVRFHLQDGSVQELRVGKLSDDSQYYVSAPPDETIYRVSKPQMDRLWKKPEDLRRKPEVD